MKKILILITVLSWYSINLFAQGKVKPYQMLETDLMKPRRGHEQQFEDAVKAHDAKFHTSDPYKGRLSVITAGPGSDGWYMWTMGPLMYTDLDHEPNGSKPHDDDWNANVDPHIEQYGETSYWKLQDSLSYTPANYNPDHVDVWVMDIKPGMRPRFGALMKKWKGMWDAKKYPFAMRLFYNDLWSGDGKDAAIVYSFNNYAEFDFDYNWKTDYEALNGAGSYDNFWKEWNECIASTSEQLRKFIK